MFERSEPSGDLVACDKMWPVMGQERAEGARSTATSDIDGNRSSSGGGGNELDDSRKGGFQRNILSAGTGGYTNKRHGRPNSWPLLSRDLNAGHSSSCRARTRVSPLCDNSCPTCVTDINEITKTNKQQDDNSHKSSQVVQMQWLIVERRELARDGNEARLGLVGGGDIGDHHQINRKWIRTSLSGLQAKRIKSSEQRQQRRRRRRRQQQQVRASGSGGGARTRSSQMSKCDMSREGSLCQLPTSASNRKPSSVQEIASRRRSSNKMERSERKSLAGSSMAASRSRTRPTRCLNSKSSSSSSSSSSLFLDFTLPTSVALLALLAVCARTPLAEATSADAISELEPLPPFAPIRRSLPAMHKLLYGADLGAPKRQPPTTYSDHEQPAQPKGGSDGGLSGPATSGHNSGPQESGAQERETAASSMSSPKFTRTNELEAFFDDMNHKELQTVASGRPIEDLFQPKPLEVMSSQRRPQTSPAGAGGEQHSTAAESSANHQTPDERSSKPLGSGLMGSQSEQQIYSDCALILQRTYVKNMMDSKYRNSRPHLDEIGHAHHSPTRPTDPTSTPTSQTTTRHQLVPFGKTEQACISYKHIDKAIEQAKKKLKFKEFVKMRKQTAASSSGPLGAPPPPPPLDVLHTSLEPPEDLVAAIGEINMAATQIIADQFDLSNDELLNGLPLIDMSKTKFAAICPLLVRQDLKCEVTRFRSFTGHCNNLKHPTWGAAKTPYARYLPPVHPDGIWVPRKSIVSEVTFDLGEGHRETHTDFSSPSMRLPSVHQDDLHHGRRHFPSTIPAAGPFGPEAPNRMGAPAAASSLADDNEPNSISELESQADAELMRETRHSQPDTAASISFASHVRPEATIQMRPVQMAVPARVHFGTELRVGTTPVHHHHHHHHQQMAAAFNEAAAAAAAAHIQHMDPQAEPDHDNHHQLQPGSLAMQSLPAPTQVSKTPHSVAQELPSARLVSSLVHRDADVPHHEFSMLFQSWGQLLDHDMTRAAAPPQTIKCCPGAAGQAASKHKLCLPIEVPPNDPFYSKFNVRCLEFRRTLASVRPSCVLGPRVHQNANTAPIDANFVYGSSQATADSLRLFKGGRLRDRDWFRAEGLKPLLPAQEVEPDLNCIARPRDLFCFLGGDVRVNEQTHLTVLHTLYMREHNRIADKLSELNPHWDDERTFQETRHLVAAGVQHVLVNEYIPLLIGRKMAELYNLTVSTPPADFGHHHHHHHQQGLFWHGYDPTVTTSVANSFAAAAFRQGHTFVQSTIDRFNKFHEFLSSEKLRHLFMQPFLLYQPGVMDELISGMINRQSQSYDPFMTVELAGHLFQPPEAEFGLDLAAINVQRGRDQGLPGYNLFREWCGLPRAETFEQLEPYLTNRTAFLYSKLYKHVDDIDLWSAGISERKLPGAAIGPTFSCIIARQFSNTRRGDRFWYENPNLPSSFTADQLNEIKKFTLAKLICSNADDLPTIQQWAFRVAHPVLNPRVDCSQLPEIDLQYWQEV